MPNWCYNNATIEHNDPTMIKKIVDSIENDKGLFKTFIPYPEKFAELDRKAKAHFDKTGERIKDGYNQGGYQWCCNNWGTKWDIRKEDIILETTQGNIILISFSTAWSPPIQFYDKLIELGFNVYANYEEGGEGFLGVYNNGEEDDYHYPYTIKDFEKLPQHIQNEFSHLKESIEEYEKENQE
jgi:hypothetical protein